MLGGQSRDLMPDSELIGACFGSYRLVRAIGRGSMGEVFAAEHVLLGRPAAVKVLLPELTHSDEAVSRFFNEARAVATMHHESLVALFDFGTHESGSAYIAMELLSGETLAQAVDRRQRLPLTETLQIARKIAAGMASAHACGVVHRDLKPENIILIDERDDDGNPKLKIIDFGIAKLAHSRPQTATRTGTLLGTPAFMSPEQCHGVVKLDQRSDVYALGCVIYFMLTGRPPFQAESVGVTIAAHLYDQPLAPSELAPGLPPHIDALVLRLLEKSPDDRPASMHDVGELLEAALAADLPPPRAVTEEVSDALDETPPPERAASRPGVYRFELDGATRGTQMAQLLVLARTHWRLAAASTIAVAVGLLLWRAHEADADGRPQLASLPALPVERPALLASAPAPEPAGALISLRVTSRPSGADVVRTSDGELLGVTPLELALPASAVVVSLKVRKAGYTSELVELPGDRDGLAQVVLAAPRVRRTQVPRPKTPVKDGALNPFVD